MDHPHEAGADREAARHARHLAHREAHEATRARDEVDRVKTEIDDVVKKQDIHVHNTHEWLHKLGRATKVLLRDHEEELDNAEKSAAWVNDALSELYDANKQITAISKAIVEASGHRTAKGDDFTKAAIADKAKALTATLDKALSLIPEDEGKKA